METSHAEMEISLSYKGCNKETSYAGWSQHCITHHSKVNGKANADDGDMINSNEFAFKYAEDLMKTHDTLRNHII